jgi:hypothetical protein
VSLNRVSTSYVSEYNAVGAIRANGGDDKMKSINEMNANDGHAGDLVAGAS